MKLHYLIDADTLIYKSGCSNEKRWYDVVDNGIPVATYEKKNEAKEAIKGLDLTIEPRKEAGPLAHSLSNVKNYVEKILDSCNMSGYTLFIQGQGNFRKKLYKPYKANRDPLSRPIHEKEIKRYLLEKYLTVVVHGEESDDRVSWLQCTAEPETTSIASVDKDLNNTAGWHYNYDKEKEYLVTPSEADWNFWRQMITGDSTDNIPGIKGAGKRFADKLLPEELPYWEMEDLVWEAYQEKGYDIDYFTVMGRLLWMRRKENEMWEASFESDSMWR